MFFYTYINLWKQLTYPITHEAALNKYNVFSVSQLVSHCFSLQIQYVPNVTDNRRIWLHLLFLLHLTTPSVKRQLVWFTYITINHIFSKDLHTYTTYQITTCTRPKQNDVHSNHPLQHIKDCLRLFFAYKILQSMLDKTPPYITEIKFFLEFKNPWWYGHNKC